MEAPEGRSDGNAGTAADVVRYRKAGILERQPGSRADKPGASIEIAQALLAKMRDGIKIGDLTRGLYLEWRRVKECYRAEPRPAADQSIPESVTANADG
jgi:hypothetical protein